MSELATCAPSPVVAKPRSVSLCSDVRVSGASHPTHRLPKSSSATTRRRAAASRVRRTKPRSAAMLRSSARNASAGPSSRLRCLAGGDMPKFGPPVRDLSDGATRGRRRARKFSSGASRRSSEPRTSGGMVHATGAPVGWLGRRMPPSQPAAAAAAPVTPPPSAAPALMTSRSGLELGWIPLGFTPCTPPPPPWVLARACGSWP
mmetsp:Transcript_1721/g.7669  ORF Transcript_1721/g.7669 Transcript_1721/m.7669 type:complete len:204 (+) Transcript_1721:309-920(+)